MSWALLSQLARPVALANHGLMIVLADVLGAEQEALTAYEEAGLDPSSPPPLSLLCERLFGTRPQPMAHLPREATMGILRGEVRIFYRSGTWAARARFGVAHEMGHGRRRQHHGSIQDVEANADLLGACLVAPRPAFERMVKRVGHSVYDLAHAFSTTHAAAMLRLGEVTGRPVRLLGERERTRGEAFDWPDAKRALRGLERARVHPVKLLDEKRWGLMAV